MTTPAPRPALKKAADAHIHPAAPGHHGPRTLRPAADGPAADDARAPERSSPAASTTRSTGAEEVVIPTARTQPGGRERREGDRGTPAPHRLTGPLGGTTSDSLRASSKGGRAGRRGRSAEKSVELTVKVPKSLRKEFRDAAKAAKQDPDAVVTALLRAWLHG